MGTDGYTNFGKWKIASNAYATHSFKIGNEWKEISARSTSFRTYLIMLIVKVLDNLGLLQQATSNNGNGYSNAATFAYYMSET
jgi:hypothetical protein